MVRALAVLVLVGCVSRGSSSTGDPDPGWSWDPPGDRSGGACSSNADCSSSAVCTRTRACVALDQVRAIHAIWTVSGAAATQTTCAAAPDLVIRIESSFDGQLSFAPVPCFAGKFTVDLLPKSFDRVELGSETGGRRSSAAVDAVTGDAVLDLPY